VGLTLMDAVGRSALPARLKPVAMIYARKADDASGERCWCGVKFVADYLGRTPDAVRHARLELVRLGILEVETIRIGKRTQVRVVRFHADRLPAAAAPVVAKNAATTGASERFLRTAERRFQRFSQTGERSVGTADATFSGSYEPPNGLFSGSYEPRTSNNGSTSHSGSTS